MRNLFSFFKKKADKEKAEVVRRAMIRYYNTINQGKVAIPSFILADIAMHRVKAFDRIDDLYEKIAG